MIVFAYSTSFLIRKALPVVAVLGLLLTTFGPAQSQDDQRNKAVAVNPRFGAVESYYRPDDAVQAGIGWDRIIFEWRYLQPNGPDDWQPQQWEPYLRDAERGGRKVVGLLKNAPHWATGTKVLGAVPLGLELPTSDPKNTWARFLRKLVNYYAPLGIHNWIIYNEPDIRPKDLPNNFFEFEGDVNAYFQMVKTAYLVTHANDPKATIHLAGLNYWIDYGRRRPFYLRSFVRRALADEYCRQHGLCFDVLTVHVYGSTQYVSDMVLLYQKILREVGVVEKRMWINEMNMRPTLDVGWVYRGKVYPTEPDVTLRDQAAFIMQGIAIALSLDIENIAIYRLYDNHYSYATDIAKTYEAWGLVRPNGTQRPGYHALRTAARLFRDVRSAERITRRGVTYVALQTANDQTIYVIWNDTSSSRRVAVPVVSGGTHEVITSTGESEMLTARASVIGDVVEFDLPPCTEPCLVKGDPRLIIVPGNPKTLYRSSAGKLAEIR
jgi:hypothetical protein